MKRLSLSSNFKIFHPLTLIESATLGNYLFSGTDVLGTTIIVIGDDEIDLRSGRLARYTCEPQNLEVVLLRDKEMSVTFNAARVNWIAENTIGLWSMNFSGAFSTIAHYSFDAEEDAIAFSMRFL